jgi:hypothetical protein
VATVSWNACEAENLLRTVFPWGAFVTVASGATFLSIDYQVAEEMEPDPVDGDAVVVLFVREPTDNSNTCPTVTRPALEEAAKTGTLRFADGGHARQPEVEYLPALDDPERDLVGRQSKGESGFIRRMRLHQSWWRTFRLRVPFGTGPWPSSTTEHGNMLDAAGDAAGLNFLTQEAGAAYAKRWAQTHEGVDPFRTRRNLMASQPMCFNVFGHLDSHHDLATHLFRELLGADEVGFVTGIEIERLSTALEDRTAFDAFVTYERPDKTPGCIAIETKLTEKFSQQEYPWAHYVEHPAFDETVWKTSDTALLGDLRWSQLWRNHLLGQAESTGKDLGPVSLLVVHHPNDADCDDNVTGYRELLHDDVRVMAVDLQRIHDILTTGAAGDADHQQWLADLADRYLNLYLSEPLDRLLRGKRM